MDTIVTGHKGYIGSKLIKDGWVGIDYKDGNDLLTCSLPKANTVYHLASQSSVEMSWKYPLVDSYNLNMTVRLVHEYPNARLIFTQSAASLDITSPYGFSKWASGEYIKKFHKNYVICILPNVFGGGLGVADIFKGTDKVTINGNGNQIRDFVHVDDIVEALIKAKDWEVGEYYLGSGKGVTVNELAKGKEITYAESKKEIRESILPNTTPNWKPKVNVLEWLAS